MNWKIRGEKTTVYGPWSLNENENEMEKRKKFQERRRKSRRFEGLVMEMHIAIGRSDVSGFGSRRCNTLTAGNGKCS